jgi:ribosomal protein S18 acetylase RimI-like enzyme
MNTPVSASWVTRFDSALHQETIALMLLSAEDEGMLGFESHHAAQVHEFVDNLSAKLNNNCWLLQGYADGKLAYSVVMERWGNPTGAHIGEIKKAIVHPRYRGNGLVLQGLGEILKRAEREHIDRFVIDVRRGGRAEKLWRSLGFREFGRLDDYSRYLGQVYEGVFMSASRAELQSARTHAAMPTSQPVPRE